MIAAVMTGVAPLTTAAHAAPMDAAEALPEDQQALLKATETGERVEVVGERTEYATVFANPDGSTLTLEQSVAPVRVKDQDGDWVKPDPVLERRSDGSVAPKAAAVDLSFSGGGDDGALVRIAREGRSIALGWSGQLPKPVLDGPSAVYADVLQGVDLRMTATVEGFRELLVVKTPEAAASPDLKRIEFALTSARLKLSETQAGGLSATDANATEVFTAPPARMWDSAGQQTQTTVSTAAFATASEAESVPQDDPVDGPGPGDASVELPVQVEDGALAVVPDADMLAKTDSSDFPIYIDPSVTWGESERTLLRSDGYEDYAWGNGEDDQGKGVGECGSWNGYYCGPGYVQRLYFEFSPASLKGKHVLDATFRITEPWAFQCDPRTVDLVRTNPISSSTTWSGRPKELDWMVDMNVSAGRGSACDPDQPVAPINFNDNPDEPNENLTPTVRDFAAGKFTWLTLELRAHNEGDTSAWKRFRNDASLVVDYVGIPAKPTGIGIKVGDARVCETDASDPAIVDSPNPTMVTTPQTASGGEASAMLRGAMAVEKKVGDTWSDAFPVIERPSTGHVGDNKPVSTTTPTDLSENVLYRYRSWTRSYWNNYKNWLSGPSNASTTGWCYFKIDTSAPKAPQITVGTPYSACTSTSCVPNGGPGKGAVFTFAPASGDSNASYVYKEDSETKWSSPIKGSTVKPTIIPQEPGTFRLWVRATDSLGRPGAIGQVEFLVAEGEGPVGRWHFDEDSGQAIDSSTTTTANQDNATLATGAERDGRGRRGEIWYADDGTVLAQPKTDKGLSLNGTAGYASTTSTVLETRSSYTVAAWVRVSPSATKTVTVLSQSPTTASPWSTKYSPFYLSYSAGGAKTWSMRVLSTTQVGGAYTQEVKAKHPTPQGAWTHVAGVFDSEKDTIGLYVNGQLQGKTAVGTAWKADGGLQIGRTIYADAYTDYLNGSVDEVAVWQTALTDKLIADEAKSLSSKSGFEDMEMVASWNPAGASGSTLADSGSGYGRTLTLQGGATLDGSDIVLNGNDAAAVTAGPVVDETGSFTATTRVELNKDEISKKPIGYTAQVLGQRTADGSSWGLWFHLTGKVPVFDPETETEVTKLEGYWRFGRLAADGTTFTAVSSDQAAILDSPVRLTGVYDALGDTGPVIRLYVGYTQNDADKGYTAVVGTGDLAVGKGFSATAWSHFLPARISDIRLWAGAVGSSEQLETVLGD